ncbi:hypothetical protein ACFV1W_31485 [Kitasatospora sp. NPDC059648]|uniref:hypothetical protein n=1 Tax=Kitasatospora sp. NPDC059648 TaxID=3346894 RepID=UPI00369408E9
MAEAERQASHAAWVDEHWATLPARAVPPPVPREAAYLDIPHPTDDPGAPERD